MKKIIVVILILLFSLGVFVSYDKHFKYYLGKEYKNEITLLLENEIPKSMKEVDGLFKKIENEKDSLDKKNLADLGINTILFYFYSELIEVTQKYTDIKKDLPNTDFDVDLIMVLYPYLKANNVDIKKLKSFLDYCDTMQTEIDNKYLKPVNK